MFRVRFSPYVNVPQGINNPDSTLMCHRVYSMDIDMMYKFMKQHKFDEHNSIIETLPDNYDVDDLSLHTLEYYQMKSNVLNKTINVATTQSFVTSAVESIVISLSNYLVFGECILNDNIPFIKLIRDTLDDLPYVFPFDFDMLEGSPSIDTSYFTVKKSTMEEFDSHEDMTYDNSSIDDLYNRFMFKIIPGQILPITLEAYIRYFVKNIIK